MVGASRFRILVWLILGPSLAIGIVLQLFHKFSGIVFLRVLPPSLPIQCKNISY
jgi:hypothetical protein